MSPWRCTELLDGSPEGRVGVGCDVWRVVNPWRCTESLDGSPEGKLKDKERCRAAKGNATT